MRQIYVGSKEFASRWSYDQLRLKQPHIRTEGLYLLNGRYFISCPDLSDETQSLDGKPILEWFARNKAMVAPIELVKYIPDGASPIPDRRPSDIIDQVGEPLTAFDATTFVGRLIPRGVAVSSIRTHGNRDDTVITSSTRLSAEQETSFVEELQRVGYPANVFWNISQEEVLLPKRNEGLHYLPAALLGQRLPATLRKLFEEDEDWWRTERSQLISDYSLSRNDMLPQGWQAPASRGFIDASVFSPPDLRNHLSLFQNVVVALPIATNQEEVLRSLAVGEDDLVELVAMGRVNVLLPQPLQRYRTGFLEKLAERAPDRLMLTRRLSGLTLVESRHRFPLLYPGFDMGALQLIEAAYHSSIYDTDPNTRKVANALHDALRESWENLAYRLNHQGAMGTATLGLAPIAAKAFELSKGKDYLLESYSAANSVEWGMAVGGVVFPVSTPTYSEQIMCEYLSNLYTGVRRPSQLNRTGYVYKAVNGILALSDRRVPVVEFASAFRGGDIERFRRSVTEMVSTVKSAEELDESVARFNAEVRRFESRDARLSAWNIGGLVMDITTAPLPPGVGWLLDHAIRFFEKAASKRPEAEAAYRSVVDAFHAIATLSHPDAVMVSKMTRSLPNRSK